MTNPRAGSFQRKLNRGQGRHTDVIGAMSILRFLVVFPDSHHYWAREFVILEWEDGDWGQFFVKKFGSVEDSSHFILDLEESELLDRDRLLEDNGRSHFRAFFSEKRLVEAGLSCLPYDGNYILY